MNHSHHLLLALLLLCTSCSSDTTRNTNAGWELSEYPEQADVGASDLHTSLADMSAPSGADMKVDMLPPLPGEPCEVHGAKGRCRIGLRYPWMKGGECAAIYKPMPEICNGMDDDCDGDIDPENMFDDFQASWEPLLLSRGVLRNDVASAAYLACRADEPCTSWSVAGDDIFHHQPPADTFVREFKSFIDHSATLGICLSD